MAYRAFVLTKEIIMRGLVKNMLTYNTMTGLQYARIEPAENLW